MQHRETALDLLAKLSGKPRGELRADDKLVGDLGLDSLKAVELLFGIEEALELEIGDEAAAELTTVGDVLSFLDNAMQERK